MIAGPDQTWWVQLVQLASWDLYLDRSDAADQCHDVTEHVIRVEQQRQRVRHVTRDDLNEEESRGEEQH